MTSRTKFRKVDYRRIYNQVAERPGARVAYRFSGNVLYFERQLREGVTYPWAQDLPPEPEEAELIDGDS